MGRSGCREMRDKFYNCRPKRAILLDYEKCVWEDYMKKYVLPELGYDFNAMEPYIDAKTMEIHYTKHHAAYVNNLNAAFEKHPYLFEKDLAGLLSDTPEIPEDIRTDVINNGGGHLNHALYWNILGTERGGAPTGDLEAVLKESFSTIDLFKKEFETAAMKRFGSGWVWLSMDSLGQLVIHSTPNQDSPFMDGLVPVIGLDVWEHAYYLNYQNRRADYVKAFWEVLNWKAVAKNYADAVSFSCSCESDVHLVKAC